MPTDTPREPLFVEISAMHYRAKHMGIRPTMDEIDKVMALAIEMEAKITSGELMVVKVCCTNEFGNCSHCNGPINVLIYKAGATVNFCHGCGAKIIE